MNQTNKLSVILILTVCMLLVGCAIAPPTLPSLKNIDTKQKLNDYLEKLVNKGEPPGLSVVVVKDNEIAYQRSFGKADGPNDIAASDNTVYQWWSLTKTYTAVAILQLVEAGKLNLNDPVASYLDFFDVSYPSKDSDRITIAHLLSHSSGLDDVGVEILGWIHFDGDSALGQTELLKLKLPEYRELAYEPGTQGRYSNLGYMVLAAIIERVSQRSYARYISEHILAPLDMEHTGFSYSREMARNQAVGSHPVDLMSIVAFHYIDKAQAIRERSSGRYWFNPIYSDQQGSTGLIGSTGDQARFMMALLNGGEGNGEQILSPEHVRLMGIPVIPVTGNPGGISGDYMFGLGWFYLADGGRVSLSHGGAGAAFVDMVRIYPDESLGITIMANSTYLGRAMGAEIIDVIAELNWDVGQ